ncbi:putative 50S ribosomal protein L17 [Besnoitia besnoiti]|uniref:Putative 50S ribosomal protein L17 n=1 Tax=Besnoitia besnoiti TaxID=94643 RepID=A0A2A9MDZ6_BESBE|nr:putative 50S ribosomal protein L17 [Besnoitia besnoiti]PFH35414.1 putative 50S ribosomal protein L17 [Besnoitia besnoiti]
MGWSKVVAFLNKGVQRRPHRRLPGQPHHQWNMLKTQLDQLVRSDRLELTLPRAQELQQYAEELIHFAKQNTPESSLIVESMIFTPAARRKLYHELCPLYAHRPFFYTRVVNQHRLRMRDAAPMAYLEFVDRPGEIRPARPVGIERKECILEEMQSSRRARRQWWNHARKLGLVDAETGELVSDLRELRRRPSPAEWEASDSEGEEAQPAERESSYKMVSAPKRALEPFYVDLPPPMERYRKPRYVFKRFRP